ncbi:aryl-alcohol dehydrogenase [Lactarius vividus]|nr:aryl-alcohol dehydrogenase [Lactarius vividus]
MTNPTVTKRIPYVRLGKSGLKVSRIILGMTSYGDPQAIEHVYLGNVIKALNLPREEIVVMTKLFLAVGNIGDEAMWMRSPAGLDTIGFHISDSVKKSLERLQPDYIDVLQCHRFDPSTLIEETMQALHDVVKAGYVRYIGMSSCYAWQCKGSFTRIHVMQSEKNNAITNNLTPFISMQNHHSLFGVGITPWSPLARGLLTRPFKTDGVTTWGNTDLYTTEYLEGAGTQEIVNRVEEISKRRGISMTQMRVTAPVVGSTSIKNLEELINGTESTLTQEEIQYLEEPYKARSVMGHA